MSEYDIVPALEKMAGQFRRMGYVGAAFDYEAARSEILRLRSTLAERDARIAELEGAGCRQAGIDDSLKALKHVTLDDGPRWPEDRLGVWLSALEACQNVVARLALTPTGADQ